MIITTIAALVYLAYTNFAKLGNPKITTQGFLASLLVGLIAVVLIVAAVILVVDGVKALAKPGAQKQPKAA
jgi:hypothetical protein